MAGTLKFWGVLGFLLAVVGAMLAGAYWPGTETSEGYLGTLDTTETGNQAVAYLGMALLGVGSTMLWVVLIAVGVYCGLRMHDERSQLGSGQNSTRPLDSTTAERLNREAQQRIVAKRAAEKGGGR